MTDNEATERSRDRVRCALMVLSAFIVGAGLVALLMLDRQETVASAKSELIDALEQMDREWGDNLQTVVCGAFPYAGSDENDSIVHVVQQLDETLNDKLERTRKSSDEARRAAEKTTNKCAAALETLDGAAQSLVAIETILQESQKTLGIVHTRSGLLLTGKPCDGPDEESCVDNELSVGRLVGENLEPLAANVEGIRQALKTGEGAEALTSMETAFREATSTLQSQKEYVLDLLEKMHQHTANGVSILNPSLDLINGREAATLRFAIANPDRFKCEELRAALHLTVDRNKRGGDTVRGFILRPPEIQGESSGRCKTTVTWPDGLAGAPHEKDQFHLSVVDASPEAGHEGVGYVK